jgi:hypothetical protein
MMGAFHNEEGGPKYKGRAKLFGMKRFHAREMALLLGPVALIGVVGFWMSGRPVDDGRLRLSFSIEKPTTLQAFRGIDANLALKVKNSDGKELTIKKGSPYVEVHTPRGVEVSRLEGRSQRDWESDFWMGSINSSRFPIKMKSVPEGTLFFGFDGISQPPLVAGATPTQVSRVSGKWKINRAQIAPTNLAGLPRKPFVSLREVVITQVTLTKGTPATSSSEVSGEAIFDLQSGTMDKETSFECNVRGNSAGRGPRGFAMGWGLGTPTSPTQGTARTRTIEWTVFGSWIDTNVNVTGFVSAGNRWPLAFEIGPFDFNKVKVGQKLKFKSWPAPVPSSTKAKWTKRRSFV